MAEEPYKTCFALVDCNNFFVSCERLFRPDLRERPVIVLSNNDGCVISRSNEAKALGIPMGVPLFKIKDLVKQHNIATFSTNFSLYLDISRRVTNTLSTFAPLFENYSVDESFLDLEGFNKKFNIYDYCHNIRYVVTRDTGIPVCVGAGPTKTLAKIANYGAKKNFVVGGVLTIDQESERIDLLKKTPIEEIWGVGKALSETLTRDFGFKTAYDLSLYDPLLMKRKLNINVAKIIQELNGISCIPFEAIPKPKKQMMWSRTFGRRVSSFVQLREILAGFTVEIAQKLREEKQYARNFGIFVQTNLHSTTDKPYAKSLNFVLNKPTNDTTEFLEIMNYLLYKIFKPGYWYYKAGIILQDLTEHKVWQTDLFADDPTSTVLSEKKQKLLAAIDKINSQKHNTVFFAAQGKNVKGKISKQEKLSPSYTTKWSDIPTVS